jgi:hypothetical protein
MRLCCSIVLALGVVPTAHAAVEPPAAHYKISAQIARETGDVTADVTITLPANELQGETAFILGERFKLDSTLSQPKSKVRIEPSSRPIDYLQKITFDFGHKPQKPVTLRFRYHGPLNDAREEKTKAFSPDVLELALESMWVPFAAELNMRYTVDATFTGIPESHTVVSQGDIEHKGDRVQVRRIVRDMDVPLVAVKGLRKVSEPGVEMYALDFDEPLVRIRRKHALASAEYFQKWMGPMPGGPVRLAVVPHNAPRGSYARIGYIIAAGATQADIPPGETLETVEPHLAATVSHEFAHAWWSLGDPMTEHYWLTESLAEYSALRYVEFAFGKQALNNRLDRKRPTIQTAGPILGHGRPTREQLYDKGCALLFELEARIGRETMDRFMTALGHDRPRLTEQFLRTLHAIAGESAAQQFEADLRKS